MTSPSNSILEALTPRHIANEVDIVGRGGLRPVVLVEGHDDKSLLFQFFSIRREQMIPAFGKQNVLAVFAECIDRQIGLVIGIVDSDEGLLESADSFGETLIPVGTVIIETGVRDADVMVLTTMRVVMRLVENWADPTVVAEVGVDELARILIDDSLSMSYDAGCLRRASRRRGWSTKLDRLPFETIIDSKGMACDSEMLILIVSRKAEGGADAEIRAQLEMERARQVAAHNTCRGHDIASVMASLLRKRFGAPSKLGWEILEKTARAIYSKEDFRSSILYDSLRHWEQSVDVSLMQVEL